MPSPNFLKRSGMLSVFFFLLLVVSGLYLIIFYKIAAPYDSVSRLQEQVLFGRWIRSLHHYSALALIVAVLVHSIRHLFDKKPWGPRLFSVVSGVTLLGFILACAASGLTLVWDEQGRFITVAGARLLDRLPFFSEPLTRLFQTSAPVSLSFFFLNLFLHVSFPLGMIFLFMVHTARFKRLALLPPKPLMAAAGLLLIISSMVFPMPLDPPADPMALADMNARQWIARLLPLKRGPKVQADYSVIRLLWRSAEGKIKICEAYSPEELKALPQHMRGVEKCDVHLVPYRLTVELDGKRSDEIIKPLGARADRPLVVDRDLTTTPGSHELNVKFLPEAQGWLDQFQLNEAQRQKAREDIAALPIYHWEKVITLKASRLALIEMGDEGLRLAH